MKRLLQLLDENGVRAGLAVALVLGVLSIILAFCAVPVTPAQQAECNVQTGPLYPNLTVRKMTDVKQSIETFASDSCALAEELIPSAGTHSLLRFTVDTPNKGDTALILGRPSACPDLFTYSLCHGHYHLRRFADYRVWTLAGWQGWLAARDLTLPITGTANETYLDGAAVRGELLSGRKQAFCLEDFACSGNGCKSCTLSPINSNVCLDCDYQGIDVGWQDEYGSFLDGQWVVLDGLSTGSYVLEVQVNPDQVLHESDYSDNSTAVKFRWNAP